jgi:hypothetical protein
MQPLDKLGTSCLDLVVSCDKRRLLLYNLLYQIKAL